MSTTGLDEQTAAIVGDIGERVGLHVGDARLLGAHSNVIVVLPAAGLVVRIATNPDAFDRVAASVAVTGWLARQGFPCVTPADISGQPFIVRDRVVSLWRHLPATTASPATGAAFGALLRRLHNCALPLTPPPLPPPLLTDPLASVARATRDHADALKPADRDWLLDRITTLRECWSALDFPTPATLIHGDAHPGNLINTAAGPVLGDWDHVAIGPREWDLIQVHYTHRRFGRPDRHDLAAFTTAYGFDVQGWPGMDTLISIREISGLSPYIRADSTRVVARRELAHRLGTLRRGDRHARWHSPRPTPQAL